MRKIVSIVLILQFLFISTEITPDMGVLRNTVFCHPDHKQNDWEGSVLSRDSSSLGLRMTKNWLFRSNPDIAMVLYHSYTLRPIAEECSSSSLLQSKYSSSGRCDECLLKDIFVPCQGCKIASPIAHRILSIYDNMLLKKGAYWRDRVEELVEVEKFDSANETYVNLRSKLENVITMMKTMDNGKYLDIADRFEKDTSLILLNMPGHFLSFQSLEKEDLSGITAMRHHGESRRVIYMSKRTYEDLNNYELSVFFVMCQQGQDYIVSVNSITEFYQPVYYVVSRDQIFDGKKVKDVFIDKIREWIDEDSAPNVDAEKRKKEFVDSLVQIRKEIEKNKKTDNQKELNKNFLKAALIAEKIAHCCEFFQYEKAMFNYDSAIGYLKDIEDIYGEEKNNLYIQAQIYLIYLYIEKNQFDMAKKQFINLLIEPDNSSKSAPLDYLEEPVFMELLNDFKKMLFNSIREYKQYSERVYAIQGLLDDMHLVFERFLDGERRFAVIKTNEDTGCVNFLNYSYELGEYYKGCLVILIPRCPNNWKGGFLVYYNGNLIAEYTKLNSRSRAETEYAYLDRCCKFLFGKTEGLKGLYTKREYEETRMRYIDDPKEEQMRKKIEDALKFLQEKGGLYAETADYILGSNKRFKKNISLQIVDLREDGTVPMHTFAVSRKGINYIFKALWVIGLYRRVAYVPRQMVLDFDIEHLAVVLYCIGNEFKYLLEPKNRKEAKILSGLRRLRHNIGAELIKENPFDGIKYLEDYVHKWHVTDRVLREALRYEEKRLFGQLITKRQELSYKRLVENIDISWVDVIDERKKILNEIAEIEKNGFEIGEEENNLLEENAKLIVKLRAEDIKDNNLEASFVRTRIEDLSSILLRLGLISRLLDHNEKKAQRYFADSIIYLNCAQFEDFGAWPMIIPRKLVFAHIHRGEYCEAVFQVLKLIRTEIGRNFLNPYKDMKEYNEVNFDDKINDELADIETEECFFLLSINKGTMKKLIYDAIALLKIDSEVRGNKEIAKKAANVKIYLLHLLKKFYRCYDNYMRTDLGMQMYIEKVVKQFKDEPQTIFYVKKRLEQDESEVKLRVDKIHEIKVVIGQEIAFSA